MVGLLGIVVLVEMGEKLAEQFLPIYLLAVGGNAISIGLLSGLDNLLSALYSFPGGEQESVQEVVPRHDENEEARGDRKDGQHGGPPAPQQALGRLIQEVCQRAHAVSLDIINLSVLSVLSVARVIRGRPVRGVN